MPMWEAILAKLAARLKEPSSWIGIGVLATSLGMAVKPEFASAIGYIGAGVFSIIAMVLPDPGSSK